MPYGCDQVPVCAFGRAGLYAASPGSSPGQLVAGLGFRQLQHFPAAEEAAKIKARISVNAGSLPMPRYTRAKTPLSPNLALGGPTSQ